MTNSQIKNLGFSIFIGIIILYVLLFNFSWIGLAGASIFIALIFYSSLLVEKDDGIMSKLDLYALFMVLALISVEYQKLMSAFGSGGVRYIGSGAVLIACGSIVAGLVLNNKSKNQTSNHAKIITKYLGLFIILEGITLCLFGDATGLVQNVTIFIFCGFIKYCRLQLYTSREHSARCEWVAVCLSAIVILLHSQFAAYHISYLNLNGFFSVCVFPWYNVLGVTLICSGIGGAYIRFSRKTDAFFDEDILFLNGLVGFVWVLKSSLYFYFDFHWLAICIYGCFFIGYVNHFIRNKKAKNKQVSDGGIYKFFANENYMVLITAFSIVIAVYLTNHGYLSFWLALLISVLAAHFIPRNFKGWIKDAMFWQIVLFCIAISGILFTTQIGYSEKKIILISAIFIFTSVVMWMMNNKNGIGQNKFKITKIVLSVIFGILVFTTIVKSGSNIDVANTNPKANAGSFLKADTSLKVTTSADGRNNSVTKLKCIWADSFFYDEDLATVTEGTEMEIAIQNHHLILWATDMNGIVTKKDSWFYRAPK